MKKYAVLLVALLMVQLLAGCGNSTPGSRGAGSGSAVQAPATSAPAASTPAATLQRPQATSTPAASPTTVISPGAVLSTPQLEYGINAHLFYTDRERALTLANNAGFGWVRQQIHWKDIEGPKGNFGWQELDAIVSAARAHNLKLLVTVVRSPEWAREDGADGMPDNPKDLGDFVAALASRYKGNIHAYEIWNEQNLHYENGGRVTPDAAEDYAKLLMEAYTRIKAVDPNAYVLSGAPASTGVNDPSIAVDDLTFLQRMYSYKGGIIKDYFDAQAVHPGAAANPPDTLWPDQPSQQQGWNDHPSFYFRHVENVRRVMEEYGLSDHQIWITEFGWATQNNTPGYEFGEQTSLAEQGQYILGALQQTRNHYPWVGAIMVWNLNFSILWGEQGNPFHEQASFSILNPDWSPRPAFGAVQGFIHAVQQEEDP